MGRPSSGEKPMEVSTDRPLSTAQAEQPAPSWSVTAVTSRALRPSTSASDSIKDACAMPWKP